MFLYVLCLCAQDRHPPHLSISAHLKVALRADPHTQQLAAYLKKHIVNGQHGMTSWHQNCLASTTSIFCGGGKGVALGKASPR